MDINALMRQAQQMQKQMQKKQEELEKTVFTAEAGGGAVKVSLYGNYIVDKITFAKDVIDPEDPSMLEDLVTAAFNEAVNKIKKAQSDIANGMRSSLGGF